MSMTADRAIPEHARRYGAVWRWHFYAGLFTAPFLLILAVTGMIYLFNDELNDMIYPELRFASSPAASQPPGRLFAAALEAFPGGRVTRIDMPTAPGRSAQLFVTTAEGEALRVFLDPPTARVLGSHVYTSTLVGFADVFHGSLMMGDFGDAIVELAACWGFILVASGLYLWWPRGGSGAAWRPRTTVRGRAWWRELHKTVGLYTAPLILFLIVTGLPWATIWGDRWLSPLSNALGLGYPAQTRHAAPAGASTVLETVGESPWALQQMPMPASENADLRDHAAHARHGHHHDAGDEVAADAGIDVDAAVAILAAHGMSGAYRLSLPVGAQGVYMAYTYPDRPEGQRTLQLDRYSGAVITDIGFDDYGAIAKAVEWGVALHMGNYFGRANQLLMLLPCIAIIALLALGIAMWWRRRPSGRLGAPPAVPGAGGRGHYPGLRARIIAVAVIGLFFPLAGASLLLIWLIDALVGGILGTRSGR
jgi:uncharacterized iron-regulated membrane protein